MNVYVTLANDGYFIVEAHTVGATIMDVAHEHTERLSPERKKIIEDNMEAALDAMTRVEPQGSC